MRLIDFLEEVAARYELHHHRPTFSAEEVAEEEHVPGINVAKPVIVEADGEVFMCVVPGSCRVDIEALKGHIEAEKIKLVSESRLRMLFGDCAVGAEPPFGELYGLMVLMDRMLEQDDYIVFQAGTHEDSIRMSVDDFMSLAAPRILEFSSLAVV